MTSEKTPKCGSQTFVDGVMIVCDREPEHESVHLGRMALVHGGEELMQWNDNARPETAHEAVEWIDLLPFGQNVEVGIDSKKAGGVLADVIGDHNGQPGAIILSSPKRNREGKVVGEIRTLVPWGHVSSLLWVVEP